ncbi:MAG: PaaI family thioesterase [Pseudomonadota bacterium]
MPPVQNDSLTNGDEATRIQRLSALVDTHFPQVHEGARITIEALPPLGARVRLHEDPRSIRPGGTVSGPAMFKLADFGVWAAIIAHLGTAGIESVTTSLTINFLRRPAPGDLIGDIQLLKVGRRLAVADVRIWRDDPASPLAHATATYAIPPEERP